MVEVGQKYGAVDMKSKYDCVILIRLILYFQNLQFGKLV
jgi:hypothetical protein